MHIPYPKFVRICVNVKMPVFGDVAKSVARQNLRKKLSFIVETVESISYLSIPIPTVVILSAIFDPTIVCNKR